MPRAINWVRVSDADKLKHAATFASIPGVKVVEVRSFLGLPPLGDPDLDELVLNLPADD